MRRRTARWSAQAYILGPAGSGPRGRDEKCSPQADPLWSSRPNDRSAALPPRSVHGRVPVAKNVSFLDAKRAAPSPGRTTASGEVERRQWVGSTSSPVETAVIRTRSTGLGARRVGCTSLTGHSPRRVGAGPMAGMRRTPCIEAPDANGSTRCKADGHSKIAAPTATADLIGAETLCC